MWRCAAIGVTAFGLLMAPAVSAGVKARAPAVFAKGNGGVCSLSKHKSFHLAGSGWRPGSTVRVLVIYPDDSAKRGQLYSPMANSGLYKVNSRGNFISSKIWTCWPTPTLNYPDLTGTYLVFAYQRGSSPPVMAKPAYFRITK